MTIKQISVYTPLNLQKPIGKQTYLRTLFCSMSQLTTYIAWFLPLRCCTVYSSMTFLATIIACSPTTIWRVKISWTSLIEKKHRVIYPTKHSSWYSILKINHISDQIYQSTHKQLSQNQVVTNLIHTRFQFHRLMLLRSFDYLFQLLFCSH